MSARAFYWIVKAILLLAFGILFYDLGLAFGETALHMGPVCLVVGTVSVLFVVARRSRRVVAVVFPVTLVIAIALNVAGVLVPTPAGAWKINPHESNQVLDLARNNPAPLAQTSFSLHYYMFETLRGKRLKVYSDTVFDAAILHRVARPGAVEVDSGYDPRIRAGLEEELEQLPGERFTDIEGREFAFIVSARSADEYIVLRGAERHYVIASSDAGRFQEAP